MIHQETNEVLYIHDGILDKKKLASLQKGFAEALGETIEWMEKEFVFH